MARTRERRTLSCSTPGTHRSVTLYRYGDRGTRPKIYVQAAIHADETPALLFAHHLVRRLDEIEAAGGIAGEIVVVPCANPIGLAQWINARHVGRHELGGGINFNRHWPDPLDGVADEIAERLSQDPSANLAAIRAAMRAGLERRTPRSELESLRLALAVEAVDADIVLDVHSDDEALVHLYLLTPLWPDAHDLSADVESRATLLADDSGGGSFDETMSSPWPRLAACHPDQPIPQGCLAATLELRGRPDVSDALAAKDVAGIVRFLQRRGALTGDPGPLPAALCTATPLDAVDLLRTPAPGITCYRVELGETVTAGQVIADLVDPAAEDPAAARIPLATAADGLVLTRRQLKYVAAGTIVAKIVGTETLAQRRGAYLLSD
jgi:predicted deacylase